MHAPQVPLLEQVDDQQDDQEQNYEPTNAVEHCFPLSSREKTSDSAERLLACGLRWLLQERRFPAAVGQDLDHAVVAVPAVRANVAAEGVEVRSVGIRGRLRPSSNGGSPAPVSLRFEPSAK